MNPSRRSNESFPPRGYSLARTSDDHGKTRTSKQIDWGRHSGQNGFRTGEKHTTYLVIDEELTEKTQVLAVQLHESSGVR